MGTSLRKCNINDLNQIEEIRDGIKEELATLKHAGQIKVNKNGFVYLELCSDYILKAIHILSAYDNRFVRPPYFGGYNSFGTAGAHVTILDDVREMEHVKREEFLKWISEKKPIIDFKLRECKFIFVKSWHRRFLLAQNVDICIIEVESEKLNEIQGLHELPHSKYPYHITLAVRYKGYL